MTLMTLLILLVCVGAIVLAATWLVASRGNNPGRTRTQNIERADKADSRRFPYRYADQHLFVHGDTVWTGVRFNPVTDEYLSHDELLAMVDQSTRALQSISGDEPIPFQTRVTYRPVTAADWAEDAINACWDPTPNHKRYLRGQADYLTASETARPEAYLLVQVGKVGRGAQRVSDTITGTADEQFDPDEVARWDALATEVHAKLRFMGTVPMTRDDLLWLIRKPLSGHYTPTPVEFGKTRPWGAGEFALALDFTADNYRHGLLVHHINDDANMGPLGASMESHMCVLLASEWPERMEFRRSTAWMRFIANLGAQAEINYRGVIVPQHKFLERAEKINGDLTDEARDMDKVGAVADRATLMNRAAAQTLVDDIKSARIPGIDAQIMLALSASTEEALADLVRQVQNVCSNHLDVKFVRPRHAQWRLLESFLPGTPPTLSGSPRVQMQEAEVFGVGLPNAGTEVGDNPETSRTGETLGYRGDFIGGAGDVPAHYSMPVGVDRNSGGGVAIIGASGSGKTSLSLMKFFQESEAGARCVALDPKVDFAQFCYYIAYGPQVNHADFPAAAADGTLGTPGSPFQPINQRFWDDTDIIDVLKSGSGVFDPWRVTGDLAEGEALAQTMVEMFLGPSDWTMCRTPFGAALRDVRHEYEAACITAQEEGKNLTDVPLPTLWRVVDKVNERFEQAKSDPSAGYSDKQGLEGAAVALERLRSAPYARLAFSPTPSGLGALRKRRTVFTLRGMQTPKAGSKPEQWSNTQRMAATIMYVLTRVTADMLDVRQERNPVTGKMGLRPKIQFIDEAYAVTGTDVGRDAVRTALAQGRAYRTITVLIDQQAARLAQIEQDSGDEATGNQFHTVFVFKQKTLKEASGAVPLLGREDNKDAVARALLPVSSGGVMDTGVCLMRDVDGRVATVTIDLVYRELLAATDTNPSTRPVKQSVPLSDDVNQWFFISPEDRAAALAAAAAAEEPLPDEDVETTAEPLNGPADEPRPDVSDESAASDDSATDPVEEPTDVSDETPTDDTTGPSDEDAHAEVRA